MKSNVIIVGMPRSGTSMLANIFVQAGYFVSSDSDEDLRPGDEFNPSGYWESKELIDANDAVFSAIGFEPDNTWLYKAITSEQANHILKIPPILEHSKLVEKFNDNSPWIWKDPRLCYTIGYWWQFLKNTNTKIIFLKRDKAEIYNSFLRLNWRNSSQESKNDVFQRVDQHITFAKQTLASLEIPHIEVWYSDFKDKPEETSVLLKQFTGLNLTNKALGFNKELNTSSIRGRLMIFVDWLGDMMPDNLRKGIKKIIPTAILKFIFPHRYTNK